MYNERKENFAIQDVILQISFVVLFVFLLLWLFPTKDFVKKELTNVISGETFAEKVDLMKNAAQSYFTIERLPAKVGDKVKLTLKEMGSRKLLLAFDESYNCDINKSYVEITKMDKEYVMKVNLSCGTKTDYVLVYMGCYNDCETTVCEKNDEPIKPVVLNYEYQYKKGTAGYWTNYSDFGAWTTVKETTSESKREETKTEQVFDKYESYQVQTGTTSKQVFDHYESKTVQTGTTSKQVFDHYEPKTVQTGTKTVGTGTYTRGSYIGRREYTSARSNTATNEFVYITTRIEFKCTTACTTVAYYVYDVYNRTEVTTTEPIYTTTQVAVYKTVTEPVYETTQVAVYKTVTEPVFETRQRAIYKNVVSYRYQTRTYVNGTLSTKWSKSKTDATLLNSGYTLTGLKEVIMPN